MGLKMPPSPTKQIFANVVEEREARKAGLARLSLFNRCEDWREGGC